MGRFQAKMSLLRSFIEVNVPHLITTMQLSVGLEDDWTHQGFLILSQMTSVHVHRLLRAAGEKESVLRRRGWWNGGSSAGKRVEKAVLEGPVSPNKEEVVTESLHGWSHAVSAGTALIEAKHWGAPIRFYRHTGKQPKKSRKQCKVLFRRKVQKASGHSAAPPTVRCYPNNLGSVH